MGLVSEDSVVGKSNHHRGSPWICSEKPIESGLLVLTELIVAGQAGVQVRLCRKRGHQVVRAPDERNSDSESVISSAHHRRQTFLVIRRDNSPIGCARIAPDLVMAVVVPGIPLIVPRGICTHPWRDGLTRCVLERIAQITPVAGKGVKLRSGELHVVNPVVFLVVVRGSTRSALADAGKFLADGVCCESSLVQLDGECRIALPIDCCGESESGGVLASGRCESVRSVLVLEQSLWLSCARVHRSFLPLSPAVIR